MESHGTKLNGHVHAVLTVPEVAGYLKVSAKTVYSLIKDGSLNAFRVGRSLRCRLLDVEEFIAAQVGKGANSNRIPEENVRAP
jgi:excisionase family DNA binding protein